MVDTIRAAVDDLEPYYVAGHVKKSRVIQWRSRRAENSGRWGVIFERYCYMVCVTSMPAC